MNRTPLVAIVVVITAIVAGLGFWTSAELVASILFTFPVALCALQRSKWLLWGTAAAAALLTIAAELWGFSRVELVDPGIALVNRGLLIASLFTLATLIHFWVEKTEKGVQLEAFESLVKSINDFWLTKVTLPQQRQSG